MAVAYVRDEVLYAFGSNGSIVSDDACRSIVFKVQEL